MNAYPEWLRFLAWVYLALAFAGALAILVDEFRRPQKMFIMNLVWPITALYFGPLAVPWYFKSGLKSTRQHHQQMKRRAEQDVIGLTDAARRQLASSAEAEPTREQVAVATTHCGAGCTLGDIVGEWWIFGAGLMLAGGELGTRLLLDFLLAWGFGILFQYFTIVPMRGLSFGKGLLQAMRADTLSIVAFQVGMSAWAALVYFVLFPSPHLKVNEAVFWFMMQIGMLVGFLLSYPANVFLVKRGWKEKMPPTEEDMKRKAARKHLEREQMARSASASA